MIQAVSGSIWNLPWFLCPTQTEFAVMIIFDFFPVLVACRKAFYFVISFSLFTTLKFPRDKVNLCVGAGVHCLVNLQLQI